MTDLNKQELRRLAEAAGPGPWCVENGMDQVRDNADDFVCATGENEPRNSAFIAAANPAAILSLLDELDGQAQQFKEWQASHHANYCSVAEERDQLRAEVEALRKDAERWRCVRNAVPMQSPYAVWREGSHPVFGRDADELVDNFLKAREGRVNG